MDQAAAMPKAALSGTEMAAMISVSLIADSASREARLVSAIATPSFSASANTTSSGARTRMAMAAATAAIRLRANQRGSVVARRKAGAVVIMRLPSGGGSISAQG